jgi:hypothetical protein
MGDLRLVDRNDHGQDSDSNACDETADVEHCDHNAGGLYDTTDDEDATCYENSTATAKTVGVGGEKSATKASRCE